MRYIKVNQLCSLQLFIELTDVTYSFVYWTKTLSCLKNRLCLWDCQLIPKDTSFEARKLYCVFQGKQQCGVLGELIEVSGVGDWVRTPGGAWIQWLNILNILKWRFIFKWREIIFPNHTLPSYNKNYTQFYRLIFGGKLYKRCKRISLRKLFFLTAFG